MCGKAGVKHESQYFSVTELTEGVYAAVEKDGRTGSNAGIIDLGDYSLLFDTFLNIDAARELVDISRKLGCSPIRYVVNSHYHTDHIVGNSLLWDSTAIISSAPAREEIIKMQKEFEGEKVQYGAEIEKLERLLANETDKTQIADMKNGLSFLTNLVKPGVGIYPPNLVFDKELVLHGSKRSVKLIAFDKAHTAGDVVALLPEEGICFAGDLVLADTHPWLGNGDPEGFLGVLRELTGLDIKLCVTGHGKLAGEEEIGLMIRYIEELLQLVNENSRNEGKELSPEDLSEVFREWDSLCFSWNVNFLMEKKKKSDKPG